MKSKCFIATLLAGAAILGFCNTGAGAQFSVHKKPLHAAGPATHSKAGVKAPSSKPPQFRPEKPIRLLPDLVVERIWLNRGYIAFSVKNAGKGAIPDRQHQNGRVNVTYGGKTQTCAFTRKINGNAPVDPKGILKSAGRAVTYTTGIKPGSSARTISVTVFVDNTRQVLEQNERNNTKTVRLAVPCLRVAAQQRGQQARKAGGGQSALQHPAALNAVSCKPLLSIARVHLQHGTVHVRLKNRGKTNLTSTQLRSVRLHLSTGAKAGTWFLGGIGHGRQLLRPGGHFDFDTGIRVTARTDVRASLTGVRGRSLRTARLAPALPFRKRNRAPVTGGKPATRDLKMSRVGSLQHAPGTGPGGNLQVGLPDNLKPAPKKPKWNVKPQTPLQNPAGGLQVRTQRDAFGERNDTEDAAYPLPFRINGTYQAAFHDEHDVDWYSFNIPNQGLGSWVQITVQSVKPAHVEFNVDLQGWESVTSTTHARLWAAFQKGLTGYLGIEPDYGQIIAAGGHLDYDIVLQSGVIPDANTSMDDQGWEHHPSVELELGQPRRAYMAAVGDADGHEIGAWDWFIYPGYKRCRNYCVQLSQKGLIILQNPEGGSFPDGGETRHYCLNDNSARADETPPLWVGIGYKSFSGSGDVPSRYKNPYTITLTEEGPASNVIGCEP